MEKIAFLLAVIVVLEILLYAFRGIAQFVLAAVPFVFSVCLLYLFYGKYKWRVEVAKAAAADATTAATIAAAATAAAAADARARGYVFDAHVADTPTPPATSSRAPTRLEIFWFVQCIYMCIITLIDCLRIATSRQSLQGFSLCPCTLAAALLTSVVIEYMGNWIGF